MSKSISILSLLLLFCSQSFAFTAKEALRNIRANYDELSSFEIFFEYSLFKGHQGEDIRERYQTRFVSDGENSYRNLGENEFIATSEMTATIDHETREIYLSRPTTLDYSAIDYDATLEFCKDVKVIDLGKGRTKLQMIVSAGSNLPYSVVEMTIDKQFWIEDITLFYNSEINFSGSTFEPEMGLPRLKIDYQEVKKKWSDKEGLTELKNYFDYTDSGFVGVGKYTGYKIIDYRPKL